MTDILVVLGTRPEAIKLFPVIAALRACDDVRVRICVTGQHRELIEPVLKLASIEPDVTLDVMHPGQPLDALTARLLTGIGAALEHTRPRRVIVQGDTATTMAAALASYYRAIPVSHVEAGLRSADLANPWPEEGNRRMIASVADQHFAPTEGAAEALRRENVAPGAIHVTGNTGIDALQATIARLRLEPMLAADLDPVLERFAGRRLVLATIHRRENQGEPMDGIAAALRELAEREDIALVVPLHPSSPARAPLVAALDGAPNAALLDPLDYPHFVRLLSAASLVLTDSGGIQEEAPALGKPVLVLRRTTERPEGVAAGTAMLVGVERSSIVNAVAELLGDPSAYARMSRAHSPYGDGKAATHIASLVRAKLSEQTA